jgi:site-specific DNA recombinase
VEGGGKRLVVNEIQASVLREIFEWSTSGHSLKTIARMLNDRKTPPPQKRSDRIHATWCPTAVRAMLRNESYIGARTWNRSKFIKAIGTNKRVSRARPHGDLRKQLIPELRIISDDLWLRVQDRQNRLKEIYANSGRKPVNRGASSAYFLSGFLICGACGANLIITSGGKGHSARYGCPQHWNRRACPNKITIRQTELESAFFSQLPGVVFTPDAIDY